MPSNAMDKRVLNAGLSIISACKRQTGDIWDAHYGAAAIASYFFVKENKLSMDTQQSVQAQAEAMLDKHSYSRPAHADQHSMDLMDATAAILAALDVSIDQLHWVGHNVIYAAVSLLAMRELGGWGIKEEIDGISSLLHAFEKTIPGRSWLGSSVSEVKKLSIDESDQFPDLQHPRQLSTFILEELSAFDTIYRAESHHDLIGHMLTFSHALNILHDLGYESYFRRGLEPLLKIVKVLRRSRHLDPQYPPPLSSPVDRLPLVQAIQSIWLPVDYGYWARDHNEDEWDYGHTFKFPFSFYNHLNRGNTRNMAAVDKFRYLI